VRASIRRRSRLSHFAVEQVRAREVDAQARRPEMLDRLAVKGLGRFAFRE